MSAAVLQVDPCHDNISDSSCFHLSFTLIFICDGCVAYKNESRLKHPLRNNQLPSSGSRKGRRLCFSLPPGAIDRVYPN